MDYLDNISRYIECEITTLNNLDLEKIASVLAILDNCLKEEKNVYVMGNGGSGSTASHMASDFNRLFFERMDKKFKFICLNDNMPALMSVANDEGYDEVFRYQLINSLTKDDVVIAISGSGNSKNIVNAIEYAKSVGALVIGFTGYDGGILKKKADISIDTNICDMQITEDIHMMLDHLMVSTFCSIYGKKKFAFVKHEIIGDVNE